MTPLDPGRLARRLAARRRLAREIRHLERCSSTQEVARQALEAGRARGLLVVADAQDAGRGRRRADWWTGPPGANLACTLVLDPVPEPAEAAGVAAACALAAACRPWLRESAAVKWPNDVLVRGAKVAGILAEQVARGPGRPPALLLGVGVNVAAAPPSASAAHPATALAVVAQRPPSREDLLLLFLWGLERRLLRLERAGPTDLEAEFLAGLRAWAPAGVEGRTREGRVVAGRLLEFSVSRGLTWGPEGAETVQPAGWVQELRPLAPGP